MGKIKDIYGQKFGRLTAIEFVGSKNKKAMWLCQCECGKTIEVAGANLRNGNTKSCGCITKKHGMFGTRIYNVWHTMKERCYVKSHINYNIYGGRGIKVCPEWQDFIPFMEWAYNNGYKDDLTIDRINPNGNYEPNNCRWESLKKQANNTRATVFLTYNGETKPASEWSEITGIPKYTITSRKRNGWSDEQCIKTKVGQKRV